MNRIEYSHLWNQVESILEKIERECTPLNDIFISLVEGEELSKNAIDHCTTKLNALHPARVGETPHYAEYHKLVMLSQSIKTLYRQAC